MFHYRFYSLRELCTNIWENFFTYLGFLVDSQIFALQYIIAVLFSCILHSLGMLCRSMKEGFILGKVALQSAEFLYFCALLLSCYSTCCTMLKCYMQIYRRGLYWLLLFCEMLSFCTYICYGRQFFLYIVQSKGSKCRYIDRFYTYQSYLIKF